MHLKKECENEATNVDTKKIRLIKIKKIFLNSQVDMVMKAMKDGGT